MNSGGDVVILGGGVIGLTTAYYLAQEGVRVVVCDQGKVGQEASWAGAGILPPSDLTAARHPVDRLRALSGRLFPALSMALREGTGIDNGFTRCGGLEWSDPTDSAADHEWYGEGVPTEMLDEPAGRQLEPALATALGPVRRVPGMAQVRNPWHLRALAASCAQTGLVALREGEAARRLILEHGRVSAIETATGLIGGDSFLLATGAWTDALLRPLGHALGIYPVRGQIALLNPGQMLFRHILAWGSRYLVPRLDGRVLVGSTEENAGFVKRDTEAAIQELLELAVRLVPALASASLERSWSGLRPGSPDGLPFLGPVPGMANLFVAAGHFRAGIQLSPGTALLMKNLILGEQVACPLEAFRLERGAAVCARQGARS